jgi:AraC-like DNA-binding protein
MSAQKTKHSARLNSKRADTVRNILASSDRESTSVRDLALALGISRVHLSRTFRKVSGESIRDFAMRDRLRRATALLEDLSLSIKEIAYRLGYSNRASFHRFFLNCAGMTPSGFRSSLSSHRHDPITNDAHVTLHPKSMEAPSLSA